MKDKYLDQTIKLDRSYYESICIPIRITLALLFLSGVIPEKFYKFFALFFIIVMYGFIQKSQTVTNTWKCYKVSIISYGVISLLIIINEFKRVPNLSIIIGMILLTNVLMGIQSKFTFEQLG